MDVPDALAALATELGVHTCYVDGLGRSVTVGPETLLRVCRARGCDLASVGEAAAALEVVRVRKGAERVPPVAVAWDGSVSIRVREVRSAEARVELEDGGSVALRLQEGRLVADAPLPPGYHRLDVESLDAERLGGWVISAPLRSWRRFRQDDKPAWGVGTHLAALRTRRSRSMADLLDLERLAETIGPLGADVITVLPLLPTFNEAGAAEPSPYSPVSRLFWSELFLDLGEATIPVPPPLRLDVAAADAEVRAWASRLPDPDPDQVSSELARYARFRGAQRRLGREWRAWPAGARDGRLVDEDVDPDEEAFHRRTQVEAGRQLRRTLARLESQGVRLGLDLAVGVHPDGYDTWSRQELFAPGISVGAPPDVSFPSGQDWGFLPVDPDASRLEGHRYFIDCVAHQASVSGVLRIDHVMAMTRLYWVPHGFDLHEGTYVSYPAEELFAVLTLESHRRRCELVGENLGSVPPDISRALPRHEIRGMHLAIVAAGEVRPEPPGPDEVGLVGTHDTPTFHGWIRGADIEERARHGLLREDELPVVHKRREYDVWNLARELGATPADPAHFLERVLEWLGRSESPLVLPWIEDLWLEKDQVNLPGTPSSARPNWQRPLCAPLDDLLARPEVQARLRLLREARRRAAIADSHGGAP